MKAVLNSTTNETREDFAVTRRIFHGHFLLKVI